VPDSDERRHALGFQIGQWLRRRDRIIRFLVRTARRAVGAAEPGSPAVRTVNVIGLGTSTGCASGTK